MKNLNTFKNNQEPKRIKPKLNPPHFEVELITFHNPNIFWGRALELAERKGGFKR